jgi:hypothetical protein
LALDATLSKIPLVEALFGKAPKEASRDELRELGAVARIDRIPDAERETLVTALLPDAPLPQERPRMGTYAALLTLAQAKGALPTETDLFGAACSQKRFGQKALDHAADGWLTYCVRDAIAVGPGRVTSLGLSTYWHRPRVRRQAYSGVGRADLDSFASGSRRRLCRSRRSPICALTSRPHCPGGNPIPAALPLDMSIPDRQSIPGCLGTWLRTHARPHGRRRAQAIF